MKKILNKILLCLSLFAMVVPTTYVYAEEGDATPIPSPSQTPEESPSNSPNPTPEEKPEPTEPGTDEPEETDKPEPTAKPTPTPSNTPNSKEIEISIQGVTIKQTGGKYTAVVPSTTETITIIAKGGKVQGDGVHTLKEGKNTITVTATETGKKYTIEVTRGTADLTLKSLKIQGQSLNESFDSELLNYTADIPHDMENIVVQVGVNSPLARFQVTGDKNLKVGKNTVQIVVKNDAGETKEYRIIVTRASQDDENSENNDDDQDTNSVSSSVEETESKITMPEIEKPNKGNPLRYVLVVIFCLVLLAVSGLGIYFYIKTGDSEKRKQKKIEKLKKKQEKLTHELTDLNTPSLEESAEILEESQEEKIPVIDELEKTIELENLNLEEETKEVEVTQGSKRRSDRNVLEDFDDLFLDE